MGNCQTTVIYLKQIWDCISIILQLKKLVGKDELLNKWCWDNGIVLYVYIHKSICISIHNTERAIEILICISVYTYLHILTYTYTHIYMHFTLSKNATWELSNYKCENVKGLEMDFLNTMPRAYTIKKNKMINMSTFKCKMCAKDTISKIFLKI